MNLVGGYGSDGSGSESDEDEQLPKQTGANAKPSSGGAAASSSGSTAGNRKVIDFSKLPVRRPLLLDDAKTEESDAPLRKAAEAENLRSNAGRSLLAALPAPKVTLGDSSELGGSGSRIDLSEVGLNRAANKQVATAPDLFRHTSGIMRSDGSGAPEVTESDEVPADVMNHPMFRNDATAGAGGDRPSLEEIQQLKETKFLTIKQDDVRDPDWYMNNMIQSGGPGLQKGKKVNEEISMYESKTWEKTTHANPSKTQKRKHQINWLAHEAMEKEAELLDRAASSRMTKSQTSMKYGW